MDQGGKEWFEVDSSALRWSCTSFLLLIHQLHLRSWGIRSRGLGSSDLTKLIHVTEKYTEAQKPQVSGPAASGGRAGPTCCHPGSQPVHCSRQPLCTSELEWNDSVILEQTEKQWGKQDGGKKINWNREKDEEDREWQKLQDSPSATMSLYLSLYLPDPILCCNLFLFCLPHAGSWKSTVLFHSF